MAKLKIEQVSLSYGEEKIIEDISIDLCHNEIVSLLGASGVGKTTLFNVIAGLHKPDTGRIMLEEKDITESAGYISYMLQRDLLLPYRTVEDNIILPLQIRGIKKREARRQVSSYIDEFGLVGTQKKYPRQLSGGMRQRAALLRTYMFSQEIALLDEPFSALDMFTKHDMHNWYLKVMERNPISTLFITHDIDEAITLSERIYLLSGKPGRIIGEIKIDVPKPRYKDFYLSEQFTQYKKKIIELLAKEAEVGV